MKKSVRSLSMGWLAVFTLILVLSPFQALAQDQDQDGYGLDVEVEAADGAIAFDVKVTGSEKEPNALKGTWSFHLVNKKGEKVGEPVEDKVEFEEKTITYSGGFKVEELGDYQVEALFEGNIQSADDKSDSVKPKEYQLSGKSETVTVEDPDQGKKESKDPETLKVGVKVSEGEKSGQLKAEAALETEGSKVEGDWNFSVTNSEGEKVDEVSSDKVKAEGTKAFAHLKVGEPDTYVIKITFEGTVDGDPVKGEGSTEYTLAGDGGSNPVLPVYQITANHDFIVQGYDDESIEDIVALIQANLLADGKKVSDAEGTWTFDVREVEGLKKSGSKPKAAFSLLHEELLPGNVYTVQIHFDGKVGGEVVKQKTDYKLVIPGMKTGYSYNGGKNTVTGELLQAEKAKGYWLTAVFDKDLELVDFKEADDVEGLKHSTDFKDLKPGEYQAVTIFEGDIDGRELVIWNQVSFKVKGNGGGQLPGGEDQKSGVGDPNTGKKIVKDVKGGKMPQTAVNNPAWMLYGGVTAAAGLLILGIVYRKKLFSLFG